jgi:hypothetical protein
MASPPAMLNHKTEADGIAGFKKSARRSNQLFANVSGTIAVT